MSYYNMKGNPISLLEWGDLFENFSNRFIKKDVVGKYVITTVWIGIDDFNDPPNIFESMIFCDDQSDELHEFACVYSNKEMAENGHEKLVNICNKQNKKIREYQIC